LMAFRTRISRGRDFAEGFGIGIFSLLPQMTGN